MNFKEEFRKIDSLYNKGLYKSANEHVEIVGNSAIAQGENEYWILAQVYKAGLAFHLTEDDLENTILSMKQSVDAADGLDKAVLSSYLASTYQAYMDRMGGRISSSVTPEDTSDNFKKWSTSRFIEEIGQLHFAAIDEPALKEADVSNFEIILTKGNTRELRPTLFDILGHRAIDFFSRDLWFARNTTGDRFSNPELIAPVDKFVKLELLESKGDQQQIRALLVFQRLLKFHRDRNNIDPLVHTDLRRLDYLKNQGRIPGVEALYLESLEQLLESSAGDARAEILSRMATWYASDHTSTGTSADFVRADSLCDEAIATAPDSYGASLAEGTSRRLHAKSLNLTTEKVGLPGEHQIVLVKYRNIDKLFVRVVKVPDDNAPNDALRRYRGRDILRHAVVLEKEFALPGTEDLGEHTTELVLDSLPLGSYAIVISDDHLFGEEALMSAAPLNISRLAYWMEGLPRYAVPADLPRVTGYNPGSWSRLIVVDRKTGAPIKGAQVELFGEVYEPGQRRSHLVYLSRSTTDASGIVNNMNTRQSRKVIPRIKFGEDVLFLRDAYYVQSYNQKPRERQSNVIFTDRSIYRPGQTVFFKGYALNFDRDGVPELQEARSLEVTFRDVNGQVVDTVQVTSNFFGTFSGSFKIPTGGLTGRMSIITANGQNSFQVEEYKRPTFEVELEAPEEVARLGDTIRMAGKATTYSGVPVANAEVNIIVHRELFMPWWPWYRSSIYPPRGERKVAYVTTALTDGDGQFRLQFPTEKPAHQNGYAPDYRYSVEAVVTDNAGEAQSGAFELTVNASGMRIQLPSLQEVDINALNNITVGLTNTSDAPLSGEIFIEIEKLQTPETIYRSRYWESPDQVIFTEEEYEAKLPSYAHPARESIDQWGVLENVRPIEIEVNGSASVDLSTSISEPGAYKLKFTGRTAEGDTLSVIAYSFVNDGANNYYAKPSPAHFEINNSTFKPREVVRATYRTELPLVIRHRVGKYEEESSIWLSDVNEKARITEVTVNENDRGGFVVAYAFIWDGRLYSKTKNINIPWSNKELNIEFLTVRDNTLPGSEEEWQIRVTGEESETFSSELMTTMYDASLDALYPHDWDLSVYPNRYENLRLTCNNVSAAGGVIIQRGSGVSVRQVPRSFQVLNTFILPVGYGQMRFLASRASGMEMELPTAHIPLHMADAVVAEEADMTAKSQPLKENPKQQPQVQIRSNLDELVFFRPHTVTARNGEVVLRFKMNEALTRWKFMVLAHTFDLRVGMATHEVVTSKPLMVSPHVPRFLRQKDEAVISARVSNTADSVMQGTVELQLWDEITGEPLNDLIGQSSGLQFVIDSGETSVARWQLNVGEDLLNPIRYRMIATSGNKGDGEEGVIPVVTDRVFVSESQAFYLNALEIKKIEIDALNVKRSASFEPYAMSLEVTSNPAWYAVQSLPYLAEFPHECLEQQFNKMFSNALAEFVIATNPYIAEQVGQWAKQQPESLLARNDDLKTANLEETPWLRMARGEEKAMAELYNLLDEDKLRDERTTLMAKLRDAQLVNGGFPWFAGGRDNRYITQYIVQGMGRLKALGILSGEMNAELEPVLRAALRYMDARVLEDYERLKERVADGTAKWEEDNLSNMFAHYIYARSFFPAYLSEDSEIMTAVGYYTEQAATFWPGRSLFIQALIASAFHRMDLNPPVVAQIQQSFEERSLYNEERGRFWKVDNGYYWHNAQLERHSLLIEFFNLRGAPQSFVDELRQYLVIHKKTNHWPTTKSTSAAIYALMQSGSSWLDGDMLMVSVNDQPVDFQDADAGTLYARKNFEPADIPTSGSAVQVNNPNEHSGWGAVYLQYFEDIDSVRADEGVELKVEKALYREVYDEKTKTLVPISGDEKLAIGDNITVRLTITVDRSMEFLHLKDMRASGFEPANVISRYKWQNGIGYYESTRDLATDFFIERLSRGTYVLEYPLRVSHPGSYSTGIATLQCMYAPEYSAHSSGGRVRIE